MVRERRRVSDSDIYHVVARGVGRCIIFEDDADRKKYLGILDTTREKHQLALLAWCLMDNHVHLLIKGDLTALSDGMRALDSEYAQYFNLRHGRVGHLFQGRFKSETVDTDQYFLTVLRYIHQNPVKAGMTSTCDYTWSSYQEYIGEPMRTDTGMALSMLDGVDGFVEFHRQDDPGAGCIDVNTGRCRYEGEAAIVVAKEVLAPVRIEEVAGMPREERNEALKTLKAARLSLRQIERLTGVSKTTVAKA
ncbi:Transposase and inactivated derivatives [Slackia heliotrinireducens]|nr:Transposase and inactivated derivatives [Slackia heliotrinireducens]